MSFINALTNQEYSAKNCELLAEAIGGMPDEVIKVAGFVQWRELGRTVAKGQKGTHIYMCVDKKKETESGEDEKLKVMKKRTVFFKHQTIELEDGEQKEPESIDKEAADHVVAKSKPRKNHSEKLRNLAIALDKPIRDKLSNRLTNTPKRLAQANRARIEGERLERTQQVMYALAVLHDENEVPTILKDINTKKAIYDELGTQQEPVANGYHSYYACTGKPARDNDLAKALWELIRPNDAKHELSKAIRKKQEEIQFLKIPGFFPTPAPVVEMMIDHAMIEGTHRVLEPSAGNGNIADAVKEITSNVDCVEINISLRKILELKGHFLAGDNFMMYGVNNIHYDTYDRILMNPPFENQQDIDHVTHAYNLLKPGGRLVAIMSPSVFKRSNSKSVNFQKSFELLGGERYSLPPNSFKESGTSINTELVIIDKEA